jgi:S-adenosylmethionine:tRNA ribosyltransferase-isomerase
MLNLSDFDYSLPKGLIAQYPLKERDSSRLLVLNRNKATIEHRNFKDVLDYLHEEDLLVLNDTKVLASRLIGSRVTGGRVEVLLLDRKDNSSFNALLKPSRLKLNEKIIFNGYNIQCEVVSRNEVRFNIKDTDAIYKLGIMPLPPYIKRKPEDLDNVRYQTVYARQEGAVASPTAGLHFTEELLGKILSRGVNVAYITLHVGCGTFKPVKAQDITKHKMEPEYFKIPDEAISLIEKARLAKKRIFAVGSTSLRTLETFVQGKKDGSTDLFIYPGYKFEIVDCLLTNFHLPRTTLFMLVCAFAGEGLIKKAYQEAIDRKYRFYSYGDAMLIL